MLSLIKAAGLYLSTTTEYLLSLVTSSHLPIRSVARYDLMGDYRFLSRQRNSSRRRVPDRFLGDPPLYDSTRWFEEPLAVFLGLLRRGKRLGKRQFGRLPFAILVDHYRCQNGVRHCFLFLPFVRATFK